MCNSRLLVGFLSIGLFSACGSTDAGRQGSDANDAGSQVESPDAGNEGSGGQEGATEGAGGSPAVGGSSGGSKAVSEGSGGRTAVGQGSGGAPLPEGCRAKMITTRSAFPKAKEVSTSFASALGPKPLGGPLEDGTYYLTQRNFRSTGSVPSRESGAIVIKGDTMELMMWQIRAPTDPNPADSAWAGTVKSEGTMLDVSNLLTCWGGSGSNFGSQVGYTATSTEIVLFRSVDYVFTKQ